MKIVFFMARPGHVRNYDETLRILAARGHTIHLAFSSMRPKRNEPPDLPQAEALAGDCPAVTYGEAPAREPDGWDRVGAFVRLLGDYARFLHPRFEDAHLLRERAAARLVRSSHAGRLQLGSRLARAFVAFVGRRRSAAVADALTRACRLGERAIRPSRSIRAFLEAEKPDVVLITPGVEIGSSQVEYLKAAQSLGIPCALCVASWDNLTNKGVLRTEPDVVFVWNEIQRREAVELHGVRPERVVLTGAPRFDEWFRRRPSRSPEELKKEIGLDPDRPYLLYLCSSPFIAPNEVPFVERWLAALRSSGDPTLESIGVLVRPHPQNALQWHGVRLGDANATIWPREGAQVTDGGTKADFYDSIAHAAAVVGVNTSALIEASILERSVFTVLAPEFAGTQQGTLHYHYLREENGGFLHEAETLPEHLGQLRLALSGEASESARIRRFVESFVRPLGWDVDASGALATGIEQVRSVAVTPQKPALGAALVRLLLAPFAAWARWRQSRRNRGPWRRRLAAGLAQSATVRRFGRWLLGRLAITEADGGLVAEARQTRREFDLADHRARRIFAAATDRIVIGPWTGDAATEVLYWIPYVRWLAAHHEVPSNRLVVISDQGVPSWYDGLAGVCVDGSRLPGIPSSIFDQVVTGFATGLVEPADVIRRSRYAPLPAPPPTLDVELPPRYAVVAVAPTSRARGSGDGLENAVVAALSEQVPIVLVRGEHDEITLEGSSLLGRRADDRPVATLSALVARASLVVGRPDRLAVALGVSHGTPTIGVPTGDLDDAWSRADLLIRISHALGSSFSLLDARQLDLAAGLRDPWLRPAGRHSRVALPGG